MLNEIAPVQARSCVTTAKIAIAIEMPRAGAKKPCPLSVFSWGFCVVGVIVMAIHHLPMQFD